jgi:hypothetical protein
MHNRVVNLSVKLLDGTNLPKTMIISAWPKTDERDPVVITPIPLPLPQCRPEVIGQCLPLTVNLDGNGKGNIRFEPGGSCRLGVVRTCLKLYPNQQQVYLLATPDKGSYFTGWGGDCIGNIGPIVAGRNGDGEPTVIGYNSGDTSSLGMDGPKTCTATFLQGPTLTIYNSGPALGYINSLIVDSGSAVTSLSPLDGVHCGTFSAGVCSFGFPPGSKVNLYSIAGDLSTFGEWNGPDCSGSSTFAQVLMDRDKTCRVSFVPIAGQSPPRFPFPVLPELIDITNTLRDRQGIHLGWPISEDNPSSTLSHFQLFKEGNNPYSNSVEMYTREDGGLCIDVAHFPSTVPYWYNTFWADDGKSNWKLRPDGQTLNGLRETNAIYTNWPSTSISPSNNAPLPPGRGPVAHWFSRCFDKYGQVEIDIPQLTSQVHDYFQQCNGHQFGWTDFLAGSQEWATISPIPGTDYVFGTLPNGMQIRSLPAWYPSELTGIVTSSFLAGDDAAHTHFDRPNEYWLGRTWGFSSPILSGISSSSDYPSNSPLPYFPLTGGRNCDGPFHARYELCNDWDLRVWPDPQYKAYSPLTGYHFDDPIPFDHPNHDNLEIENEQWLIPQGYRPDPGDRVMIIGRLAADCGEDFHGELHPTEVILSSYLQTGPLALGVDHEVNVNTGPESQTFQTLNLPAITSHWSQLPPGTQASINRLVVTGAWRGERLAFTINPPPRPTADAVLHWVHEDDNSRVASQGIHVDQFPQPVKNPNHLKIVLSLDPSANQ